MNALNDKEIMQEPYICIHQDLTVDINYSFSVLTGYNREEIIGKDVLYILNDKLKINKKVTCIDEFMLIESFFFFNKLLDFKEGSIDLQKDLENELTYLFFVQRPLLSINNPLSYTHQLISDNFTGIAIYSAEDFTLLKASKEYKKIIYDLYYQTDIIGKKVYEFIQGWLESPTRIECELVIQNKKAVVNMEYPILNPITEKLEYFDLSIAPMLDYNKVKYLVIAQNNVTEKVNYRQRLVSQNKQLEAIIDNMSDIMYILDQDERYIMQNKAAIEYFNLDLENLYDVEAPFRYYELDGTMIPFEEMPIAYMKRGIKVLDRVVRIKTHDRDLYSSLSATPIF
ncbi:MAG: PAS domain-containing protein, partial [Lutisporaceae bacterium]